MYSFDTQPPGLVHVETSGFWSEGEADAYIEEMRRRCDELRRSQGFSLVLVDGSQSAVQSAPVMVRLAGIQSILIQNPRDRAAYVVQASLGKLQAERLSTSDQLKVFLSPPEARSWVLAQHPLRASHGEGD